MDSTVVEEAMSPAHARKRKRDKAESAAAHKTSKRHRSKSRNGSTVEIAPKDDVALPVQSEDLALIRVEMEEDEPEEQALIPSADPAMTWKVSEPMGGRLSQIDPIFSPDEKHLILAYDTSIQVYSTADSLLVRRINILKSKKPKKSRPDTTPRIVAAVISKLTPNVLWVANEANRIFRVDWTTGSATQHASSKSSNSFLAMDAVKIPHGKTNLEFLLVSENVGNGASELALYSTSEKDDEMRSALHSFPEEIHTLKTTLDGTTVVGASASSIVLVSLQPGKSSSVADVTGHIFSLDAPDEICSIDARLGTQKAGANPKKSKHASGPVLDVVVGTLRGAIYVYNDVLSLLQAAASGKFSKEKIQPRKHHWHPRAVHSVKWSLDGEYFVSGGSENTLVLWQVDTGRREYLPHLPASIDSIVVSPSGLSYSLTLDDNSAMVLSTSEMKPTSYISGVQSLVLGPNKWKTHSVARVWEPVEEISKPLTAAVNPSKPSQLALCVGNGQSATATDVTPSASLLQTFDISSFQSLSKQPLARTHPTEANITPKGFPITEPFISHVAFSKSGEWLASVDEWQPPARDMESLAEDSHAVELLCLERKEIHLKFWKAGGETGSALEEVSRINEAHFSTRPESILGLASSPKTSMFATVGADGNARLWAHYAEQSSKTPASAMAAKVQTNEQATDLVEGWSCVKAIPLSTTTKLVELETEADEPVDVKPSGALTFSDDGSTLFVAYGLPDEVVLYIIDASSGEVRSKLNQVVEGEIRNLQSLGSCLIILGSSLVVYNVVEDCVRYSVDFGGSHPSMALQMTHVAVDKTSGTFALTTPVFHNKEKPKFKRGTASEIAVFQLGSSRPVLVQALPHLVIALLSTPGTPGYVVVDSAAQVQTIVQGTTTSLLAAPLSDLRLEGDDATAMDVDEDGEHDGEEDNLRLDWKQVDGADEDEEMLDDDEDLDSHGAIIVPEKLTRIFDAAPAFALPPIEDLFYQVSSLVTARPLARTEA